MTFLLPYRRPYHWQAMLAFLDARAVPATEQVTPDRWQRSLRLADDGAGIVRVSDSPGDQALRVEMSAALDGHETEVRTRLAALFDTSCDPQVVGDALGELAAAAPGLRLPGAIDPFELTVRAILGQQVTVAAARTLATRLVASFGTPLAEVPAPAGPTHYFPAASRVAGCGSDAIDELGRLGIIRARGAAIVAVATALCDGSLRLEPGAAVEPALAALTGIRGIGPWTAHYIAMRALGWRDAFPPGDVAVLKALQVRTAAEAARAAERYRPWRAYAVLHLWRRRAISAISAN